MHLISGQQLKILLLGAWVTVWWRSL